MTHVVRLWSAPYLGARCESMMRLFPVLQFSPSGTVRIGMCKEGDTDMPTAGSQDESQVEIQFAVSAENHDT